MAAKVWIEIKFTDTLNLLYWKLVISSNNLDVTVEVYYKEYKGMVIYDWLSYDFFRQSKY